MKILKTYKSPNWSRRPKGARISAIVLHYTGSAVKSALGWLTDPNARVSSHYVITRKGEVYQLVEDEKRAWHAGRSQLGEEKNVNNFSLGIELEGGLTLANRWLAYTDFQLESLVKLCKIKMIQYSIEIERVVGHSTVAPERKIDPEGKENGFPWSLFRRALQ